MKCDLQGVPPSNIRQESLSVEVTTKCNSACAHCFVRTGEKNKSLSIDLVKDIISEGYNIGYRHMHITGGEPLLWKGLFVILDYVFSIGYETVFLNSNGILISSDIANLLASYDKMSVSVSLEGPEQLHDRIRGKGSYNRAVSGIETALAAGLDLYVFTTCYKSLLPNLLRFTEKLYKDFPSINCLTIIQLIRVLGDGFEMSDELLEPEDFIKAVKMISYLNLYGLKVDVLNNPLAYVTSKLLNMPWMARSPPLHRPERVIVLANGEVALSHSERRSIGKYKPGMVEETLVSQKYSEKTEPDKIYCPGCRHYKLCIVSGMIRPSEWFRDMNPEEYYCERVLDVAAAWCCK